MKTSSILSKKSSFQDSISINAFSYKLPKANITSSNAKGEKAIIINMFKNQEVKYTENQFTYTVQQGDDKRVNKNGVLRVYDMNEPINIPVGNLLGKWKNSHIGVTLVVINEKWSVMGGAENVIFKQQPFILTAFQRLLKFVTA